MSIISVTYANTYIPVRIQADTFRSLDSIRVIAMLKPELLVGHE